jgi:hypothetical protein
MRNLFTKVLSPIAKDGLLPFDVDDIGGDSGREGGGELGPQLATSGAAVGGDAGVGMTAPGIEEGASDD